MKPLSTMKYIKGNVKKFIALMFTVILSICLLYVSKMIISSFTSSTYHAWVEPLSNMDVVMPLDKEIDQNIYDSDSFIASTYVSDIFINSAVGRISAYVWFLDENKFKQLEEITGSKLIEGRYPKDGKNEIVLHMDIAKNKGVVIGDMVGSEVDSNDSLTGKYEVVGLIDGDALYGMASLPYAKNKYKLADAQLGAILSKDENVKLSGKEGEDYKLYCKDNEEDDLESSGKMMEVTLIVLNFVIILITAFTLFFVLYIYYLQRKKEFGILMALGYSRGFVVKRIFGEMVSIVLGGTVVGILLSIGIGIGLNGGYFAKNGQKLAVVDGKYFTSPLILVIALCILSTIPILKLTKKMDCISIIEGEE
nr:ABC transporter permease [uncultured Lachnoclostridium sp.]